MKFQLTLIILVKLVSSENENRTEIVVEVTKAISRRFHLNCVTVFYSNETENKQFYDKLTKLLTSEIEISNVLQISYERYLLLLADERRKRRCSKTFNIVDGFNPFMRSKFAQFSGRLNLGDFNIWLLYLDRDVPFQSYVEELVLPFNTELITAIIWDSGKVEFRAPYRVSESHPVRVEDVGHWTPDGGLEIPFLAVAQKRRNMEGLRFRAGTLDNPPITAIVPGKGKGELDVEGYFALVWKELEERLNFTSVYLRSIDNGTGASVNGRWNGLIGMLTRNEIDVAVSEFTVTQERSHVVDFSLPMMSTELQIFFKQSGDRIGFDGILKPFKMEVWLIILAWISVAAILLTNFYYAGCHFHSETSVYKGEYSVLNSFFTMIRALTNQGSHMVPHSTSCRAIFSTAYLMTGILIPSYSAALISYVTLKNPIRPFDSLETMLQDGTYKLTAARKTAEYSYFSNAQEPLLKQVYEKLMKPVKEENLPQNTKIGLEFACLKNKFSYYGPYKTGKVYADENYLTHGCKMMTFEQPLGFIDMTIAFVKNSPYRLVINLELQKMRYEGILKRIQEKSWPSRRDELVIDFDAIEIQQVIQIHCILLIGYLIASVFLIVEKIFSIRQERKKFQVIHAFGLPQVFFV